MTLPSDIRERYEVPESVYLLNHSVGALPKRTSYYLREKFLNPWASKGSHGWPDWLDVISEFNNVVAELIGASKQDICPQANLSSSLSKILYALPRHQKRNKIVLCEEDFPTVGFVAKAAEKIGAELSFIPYGQAAEDLDVWSKYLEDAWLTIVTHAFSNRSALLPVSEVTQIARQKGVFSVVDAVQTTGVLPYDINDWSADFVLGTCVKFLCGGPGAGWMWGHPDTVKICDPLDTGWFSHADPFAFNIHDYQMAEGIERFWGGTPSIAPYVCARIGIEEILRAGVARVHLHNQNLIDHLHAHLPESTIFSSQNRLKRGNSMLIRVEDTQIALKNLMSENIHVDSREGGIRLSPHLYTSLDDMDVFISCVTPYLQL